ncbi:MAG: rod shape-determining protein MreD [Sphingomonadales bacterium]
MGHAARRWKDEVFLPASPVLSCLAMVFVIAMPYRIPGFATVMPQLPLIAVFYWGLMRPDLLPAAAVFAVGLLNDIVTGGPLGLSAIALMLARGLIVSQRRVFLGKPFIVGWCGFAIVALGVGILEGLLVAAYYKAVPSLDPVLVRFLLTVAAYPAVAWLLAHLRVSLSNV